jgi:hypothetical protein
VPLHRDVSAGRIDAPRHSGWVGANRCEAIAGRAHDTVQETVIALERRNRGDHVRSWRRGQFQLAARFHRHGAATRQRRHRAQQRSDLRPTDTPGWSGAVDEV